MTDVRKGCDEGWANHDPITKSVVMFEDVDAMFKDRDSRAGGMTFSTLLNSLDGVLHPRGALVFLTTNHIERLDDALHRPGRVDRLIEVANSTPKQRLSMWKAVFPTRDPPAILSREDPNISPAWLSAILFQNRKSTPAEVLDAITDGLADRKRRKANGKGKGKGKEKEKANDVR